MGSGSSCPATITFHCATCASSARPGLRAASVPPGRPPGAVGLAQLGRRPRALVGRAPGYPGLARVAILQPPPGRAKRETTPAVELAPARLQLEHGVTLRRVFGRHQSRDARAPAG